LNPVSNEINHLPAGSVEFEWLAIDGTVLTAAPWQDVSKFEVIAGRVERNGHMGRRFVCALPRRALARMLIAAALEQSGWTPSTQVDVVTDGARGMRSLVTSVAPRVAPKILDWFHLGMKLHSVKTPIFARTYYRIDRPLFMTRCERLWKKIRNALWRRKADAAIERRALWLHCCARKSTYCRTFTGSAPQLLEAMPSGQEVKQLLERVRPVGKIRANSATHP
jgi:hypothetical protein